MISITVSPEGDIVINQESPGERRVMSEFYYAQQTGESEYDQDAFDNGFKLGWTKALHEAMLNYVNGRMEKFFNESGISEDKDPHHNEPSGTGEAKEEPAPDEDWVAEDEPIMTMEESPTPDIRRVEDSGEPEKEKNQTWDPADTGTWTMSAEELQSRLDEAYNRGRRDGSTEPRKTDTKALRAMVTEYTDYNGAQWIDIDTLVKIAERLGWEVE